MLKRYVIGLVLACISTIVHADSGCHSVKKVSLPGQAVIVVVSNGELEACSAGSYVVRSYSTQDALPGDDTTFYISGVVHARNGMLEDVFIADLGTKVHNAVIVTNRSVGSGSYINAQAYLVDKQSVRLLADTDDMAATTTTTQIISALTHKLQDITEGTSQ
ncbi:TPA: hypothetical protein R4G84_002914 [Salmonella enterica subsp. enterica serovar Mississippi]|nr:hypothetical protein [Salmonella enterica subsp. enterica]ECW0788966.1 hypothetical protein [Salmonella enterica subsp. enterica]HED0167903.1 hypothetical protein [Salmonella enterica subsp. enterica serovar Mississippi]HED0173891.1 hypothetical protein [Salmonella enterica subsp. enterica serovar Mississippi]HED0195886.1 hypothetical protein [Salmonella enterica subsp. enterica serovar Mississippi]